MILAAPAEQSTDFDWYNSTWQYRNGFNITADANLEEWPVERTVNFTALLEQQNDSGTLDEDSIRVFEYTSEGRVKWEVPYQFDRADRFNNSTNAVGELVFTLNGSTSPGTSRYFFVYFDTADHYPKQPVSYTHDYSYGFNGEKVEINTTKFNVSIDTLRANTTSGIYEVYDPSLGQNIITAPGSERTAEYIEYRNDTHEFTFNLSRNASFTEGPLRLTMTQRGYAEYYDIQDDPQDLYVTKEYNFYDGLGNSGVAFIKVRQTVRNVGSSQTTIRSTPSGAVALDLNRTIINGVDITTLIGDDTDPYSWRLIQDGSNFVYGGIVNVNESIPNFLANYSNRPGEEFRLGVNMSTYTLDPNASFSETAFVSYGRDTTGFRDMKDMFAQSPTIKDFGPETYTAEINGSSNATVYNRNETIRLFGNATSPFPNITEYVNVSLDMNTTDTSDDTLLDMAQISDSLWSVNYTLAGDADTGTWTGNFTSYTEDRILLDFNYSSFRVTDVYFANLTLNDTVAVEQAENLYGNISLDNYRNDSVISGANISCSYGDGPFYPSQEPEPGLYSLNFTAPSPAGEYVLTCNGTKDGNLGQDTIAFNTEVAKVNPNISFIPENTSVPDITLAEGRNRTFTINVTNFANGTATATNVTLDQPQQPRTWPLNTSFIQCGDLEPSSFCSRSVEVGVPNATSPANYTVNTTADWQNPDKTLNDTQERFNVEVEENPVVNISEQLVNGSIGGGQFEDIGNVTSVSIGNYNMTNLSLTCSSGTVCQDFNVSIDPANVSNVEEGTNTTSRVNVSVPKTYTPGNYTGTINASTNETFDTVPIEIWVISKTTLSRALNESKFVADNITQSTGQTFAFESNVTNEGEAFAFAANQSILLPLSRWNTSTLVQGCGDIDVNETCSRDFRFTVANKTQPTGGTDETVTVETNWTNPDGTYGLVNPSLRVEVLSNPLQRVPTAEVNGTVEAGTEGRIGNFTVLSRGNAPIQNVTYRCFNGTGAVCDDPELTPSFDPVNVSSIAEGANATVDVNVSVGLGYPAGTYNGTIQVNSTGGLNNVSASVTVPETRSWSLELLNSEEEAAPQRCITSSTSVTGVICDARVNNTGNTPVNLSINLSSLNTDGNVTNPSQRNFSLGLEETATFNFTYNVSEDRTATYNDTYNISAAREAIPDWRHLNITILPSVPPNITVLARPTLIQQNDTVELLANVTSATRFNISSAEVNVTMPTNVSFNGSMTNVKNYTNSSLWRLYYANATELANTSANTTFRGNYTFNITASDEIGNSGFNASNFTVSALLDSVVETGKQRSGDGSSYLVSELRGKVLLSLTDLKDEGLTGAQVNISRRPRTGSIPPLRLADRQSNIIFTTNDGSLTTQPIFEIFPSERGVWDVIANVSWTDPKTGITSRDTTNTTLIIEQESTLAANCPCTNEWWNPGENFSYRVVVTEDGRFVDPAAMNLTIRKNNGEILEGFNVTKTNFTRKQQGLYQFKKQLPSDIELGSYYARLDVERGTSTTTQIEPFRVASADLTGGSEFDVNISLINDTVPQGEDIQFNISMLRQTGESGDAEVTYWVAANGTEYAFVTETIYAPVGQRVLMSRDLPIYEDQPAGTYLTRVEVDPLNAGPEFTRFSNASFRVTEPETTDESTSRETQEQTETVQRQVPGEEPEPDDPESAFQIVDAPQIVNIVRGETTRRSLSVANTGETPINDVSLVIIGIPPSWYSIEPQEFSTLQKEDIQTFAIDITPDSGADIGAYNSTFLVTSANDSIQQDFEINVFASIGERVDADIQRLEDRLADLRDRMRELEDRGMNTDSVEEIVVQIETRLQEARNLSNRSQYEEAVTSITEAENRLDEADDALGRLEQQASDRVRLFEILPLLAGALVLLAIILAAVYFLKVRHINPVDIVEDRMNSVMLEIKRRRQQEEEELQQQKQKTLELLELLDAQHEEGIMDEDTYQELYSSAEEKLERINDRLED